MITLGGENLNVVKVLYENEMGSRKIDLVESAGNYKRIELQFYVKGTDGVKQFNNVATDVPDKKTIILQGSWPSGRYAVWVGMLALAEINDKTITIVEDDSIQITNIIAQGFLKGTSFFITKVIGFKY